MDYLVKEMNPDAYANSICMGEGCQDTTWAFQGPRASILAPACQNMTLRNNDGGFTWYCWKGGVTSDGRSLKDFTSENQLAEKGIGRCRGCGNDEINWNYGQWLDEITLGSFSGDRYLGEQSPYNFLKKKFPEIMVQSEISKC